MTSYLISAIITSSKEKNNKKIIGVVQNEKNVKKNQPNGSRYASGIQHPCIRRRTYG